MNTQNSEDIFLNEIIPEIRTFMALQSESYKIVSNSSFSLYIQGLAYIAQEDIELALECFKQGSIKGNPYCQYTLYTIFTSKHDLGVKENKDLGLYFLICSCLNFSIGLINEDSAHKMLYQYIKKIDDPKKSYFTKILNKKYNGMTNFDNIEDISNSLFHLLMSNNIETRENIRKTLKSSNQMEGMFSLIELRFCHVEDGFSILGKESFECFLLDYCYELILYFNRTGLMDCQNLCQAQRESFLICCYYIIYKGKRLDSEFEYLVLELLEFCNLIIKEEEIKTNEYEEDGKKILYELKPILYLVKAYFYVNGKFLSKNRRKALEFLKEFDKCKSPNGDIQLFSDFLLLKCYYKLWKQYKEPENIGKLFQNFAKLYNTKTLSKSKSKVIEYFIAGYIQEKHFKDIKDARNFYNTGLEVVIAPDSDFTGLMSYYTFRKRCQLRAAESDTSDYND